MQAKLLRHSGLIVHSGLQFGGIPIKPSTHEHAGLSPRNWHIEFGPHGDGTHGLIGTLGSSAKLKKHYITFINFLNCNYVVPGIGVHLTNGSPVKP